MMPGKVSVRDFGGRFHNRKINFGNKLKSKKGQQMLEKRNLFRWPFCLFMLSLILLVTTSGAFAQNDTIQDGATVTSVTTAVVDAVAVEVNQGSNDSFQSFDNRGQDIAPDKSKGPRKALPKPKFPDHPDIPPPVDGAVGVKTKGIVSPLASGDGKNNISFANFINGDIIVGLGTPTGHAGEWDASKYDPSNLNQKCIWTADTKPLNGVQLDPPIRYRNNYDEAYGLYVPLANGDRARDYCKVQNGEPYSIISSKTDQTKWYCSKLCWASYYWTAGKDLDADGGYWVWPVDLINDSETVCFTYSN